MRSTTIGKIESYLWSVLHPQFLGKTSEDHHTVIKSMIKPPEHRMKKLHRVRKFPEDPVRDPLLKPRNKIEELAMSPLARSMLIGGESDEVIIFGHTHSPFFSKDKMVANSGSWVTDNNFHNTFITIQDNGDMTLNQYSR